MIFADLVSRSLRLFPAEHRQKHAIDIQLFIEAAFGFSRTEFWINKNQPVTDTAALRRFYRMRSRRLNREPVAYILKKRDFYGLEFYVDKRVLIPRPETEILVEAALNRLSPGNRVLDIGTGSGIIAICLAKFAEAAVTAVDISKNALQVLANNSRTHDVEPRITPVLPHLSPPPPCPPFRLIVSNPPYVSEHEWKNREPGVKDFEPKLALTAAGNGLALIDEIIRNAPAYLQKNGSLLMEIGYNQ